jgi:preprotein translocase subunit YajC
VRPALQWEVAVSVLALGFALMAGFSLGQLQGIPLLLLMLVAMYFLLIAPNQRKQKTWAAMLASLKSGDKVTTNGGIRGTIVSVKDDVLIIRTAPDGVKLEMVKSAIAAVTTEEDSVKA